MLADLCASTVPLLQHRHGELQLHHIQLLLPAHLAGDARRRGHAAAADDGVQARPGADRAGPGAGGVVRPVMGAHGLRVRRRRPGRVPDRRLRRAHGVCGHRRHTADDAVQIGRASCRERV